MFKQNDPVVDSVKKVMAENQRRRDVETKVNEELGIYSKKALPFEHHAEYDDLLAQRINESAEGSAPSSSKEANLAARKPPFNKITKGDVLHARGVIDEEEGEETREGGAVTRDNKPVVSPTATRVGEPSARKAPTEGPSASQRDALTNKIKSIMKEAQIDDLSKGTMKSYVKKALDTGSEKSISNLASRGGFEMGKAPDDDYEAGQKYDRKSVVRSKGIQRAVNKMTKEDVQLDEVAKSKAQQKIMAMALAMRRGESDRGSDKVKKIATDMSDEEMSKFAKTKRSGLPEKVKKMDENLTIDDVMEEIRANLGEEAFAALMAEQSGSFLDPNAMGAPPTRFTPRPTAPRNLPIMAAPGSASLRGVQAPAAVASASRTTPAPQNRPAAVARKGEGDVGQQLAKQGIVAGRGEGGRLNAQTHKEYGLDPTEKGFEPGTAGGNIRLAKAAAERAKNQPSPVSQPKAPEAGPASSTMAPAGFKPAGTAQQPAARPSSSNDQEDQDKTNTETKNFKQPEETKMSEPEKIDAATRRNPLAGSRMGFPGSDLQSVNESKLSPADTIRKILNG